MEQQLLNVRNEINFPSDRYILDIFIKSLNKGNFAKKMRSQNAGYRHKRIPSCHDGLRIDS